MKTQQTPEIMIINERIDDFPLLLAILIQWGLPGIIDRHLRRHGLHQGLSWGWIATIWLAHILTTGDHRKQPVQVWVKQAQETIEQITEQEVSDLDFTDDRLGRLLELMSYETSWANIERDLGENILRVHQLTPETVRLDTTTISGYHAGGEGSLFQYGYSKDDPSLKQVKAMFASMDPLGLPLVTEVLSGEQADDTLYIPAVKRVLNIIDEIGLLFVGDSKMSALAIRAYIVSVHQLYLCPLPLTGSTADELAKWVEAATNGTCTLHPIVRVDEQGKHQHLGEGYEIERTLSAEVDGKEVTWKERVLIVRSDAYQESQSEHLEKRLAKATDRLQALTPPPGPGKRQKRDEAALVKAADAILKRYGVEGLLTYTFERQETRTTKHIGRGCPKADSPTREIVTARYQITAVLRQDDAIDARKAALGWRAYATNAPTELLSLEQAVLTYRNEWRIERGFHRLKGAPLSLNPLFVKRDDQVAGLTNLLTIAVRLLTLVEFVARRKLKQNQEMLVGLIENNPKKGIDNPTTERLLRQFDEVTLTIIHLPGQTIRHVTPLSDLQIRILELIGLSPDVYWCLAVN
jgi:transposase